MKTPRGWKRAPAPWRAGALAALALVLLVGAFTAAGCGRAKSGVGASAEHSHAAGTRYHCPMHPTYTSDQPGSCPICGMRLVPIPEHGEAPASVDTSAAAHPYRPVEGHAVVELKPETMELTGVRTVVAREGRLHRTIRAVGTVTPDETRVHHVHTKVSGWVERLFVNASGQEVRAGQALLALYSPEMLASQEEYVRALASAEQFAGSDVPEVRRSGQELVDAAKRRLQLFDLPASAVAKLERTRQPERSITLNAMVSGFVDTKQVIEGMHIEPGTVLFTITDLSRVWIEAQVYEYEASLVHVGQRASVTLPNEPGVAREARVAFVDPYLDPVSRTLKVRFEFANPHQSLKPGMYANVELEADAVQGVIVPDAAIMDTGVRQIVYVQTAANRFEPRLVKLGTRSGAETQVLSGVRAGERVVTGANFLLDSESRLRAATAAAPGAHAGHTP